MIKSSRQNSNNKRNKYTFYQLCDDKAIHTIDIFNQML